MLLSFANSSREIDVAMIVLKNVGWAADLTTVKDNDDSLGLAPDFGACEQE